MGWHTGLPSLPCSHTCSSWYINRPYRFPLVTTAEIWEKASAETDIQALLFSSYLESQQGSSWGSSTALIPLQASRVALQWCHPSCPAGCGSACHTVLRPIHSCHSPTGNRNTHSRHRYSACPSASVLFRCCRKRLDEFNTCCILDILSWFVYIVLPTHVQLLLAWDFCYPGWNLSIGQTFLLLPGRNFSVKKECPVLLPHFCSQEPLGLPLNFSKPPACNPCSSWKVVQRCGSCPSTRQFIAVAVNSFLKIIQTATASNLGQTG